MAEMNKEKKKTSAKAENRTREENRPRVYLGSFAHFSDRFRAVLILIFTLIGIRPITLFGLTTPYYHQIPYYIKTPKNVLTENEMLNIGAKCKKEMNALIELFNRGADARQLKEISYIHYLNKAFTLEAGNSKTTHFDVSWLSSNIEKRERLIIRTEKNKPENLTKRIPPDILNGRGGRGGRGGSGGSSGSQGGQGGSGGSVGSGCQGGRSGRGGSGGSSGGQGGSGGSGGSGGRGGHKSRVVFFLWDFCNIISGLVLGL